MALETATYLSSLVATNPTSSDAVKLGDDHIRLLKSVLLATFPNLNGAVTRTPAQLNYPVPIGCIMQWYSTSGTIPSGWAACDGSVKVRTDGGGNITTPDLRDKFVLGASATVGHTQGSSSAVSTKTSSASGGHNHTVTVDSGGIHSHVASTASGGSHDHTGTANAGGNHTHGAATGAAGAHSHSGVTGNTTLTTAQIPAHRHTLVVDETVTSTFALNASRQIPKFFDDSINKAYELQGSTTDATLGRSGSVGGSDPHSHVIVETSDHTHSISASGTHTHVLDIDSDGAHTHSVTVNNSAGHTHTALSDVEADHTHTVDVTPPFMALIYIMKY
jgi:hypothetical protein